MKEIYLYWRLKTHDILIQHIEYKWMLMEPISNISVIYINYISLRKYLYRILSIGNILYHKCNRIGYLPSTPDDEQIFSYLFMNNSEQRLSVRPCTDWYLISFYIHRFWMWNQSFSMIVTISMIALLMLLLSHSMSHYKLSFSCLSPHSEGDNKLYYY